MRKELSKNLTCSHFSLYSNHEGHEELEGITSCCFVFFVVKECFLFLDGP